MTRQSSSGRSSIVKWNGTRELPSVPAALRPIKLTRPNDVSAHGKCAEQGIDALVASARVARAFALKHCREAIGGDCTWYHGVWQYLRALGILKRTPGGDG